MPTTILFFWLLVAAAIIFPACHAEQTTTPPMFENCPLNCQNGGACQVVQVVDVSSPARTNNNNNDNNGGESLQQQQQQQQEFYCKCPEAYSGYFCEYNASDDNIIDDDDEEEEEECSLPCYNGGLCEVVFDEWERCLCQDGFYGYSCEYLDESTCPIECVNGGRCTSLASAGDRRRRRSLEEGYYYCEEYHPTYCPLDCQNGGACVVFNNKYIRHHHHHHHHRRSLDQEEEYYCSCTEGYNGYLCQDDIIYKDECTLECQNGGTCEFNDDDDDDDDDDDAWDDEILGPNNHVCVCPGGYYGQVCEHHHLAAGKPCGCQNGGQCFVVSEEESSTAIGRSSSVATVSTINYCICESGNPTPPIF